MSDVMQLVYVHLEPALEDARNLPADKLPRLLGDLAEVQATALARLTAPSPAPAPDELLNVSQAAEHLHCSKVYLYKNAHALPFAHRLGKKLLFSRDGIAEYLRHQK